MRVPHGTLVAVVGNVGAGKSSLVQALLGQMHCIHGSYAVCARRIAYVPQHAWVLNCSLRDNILFGQAMDTTRYERVLDACALREDLVTLPAGEFTMIGERVS